MHRSHVPLKTWFMAIKIGRADSNGIEHRLSVGLGSGKSRSGSLHKLRTCNHGPPLSLGSLRGLGNGFGRHGAAV